MTEDIFSEVRELLEDGQEEIIISKNSLYDKRTEQFSLKIPKSLALKSNLNDSKEFVFVFNPKKEETKQKINKSKFVIYLKDGD
jgi:hypothetical protein